LERNLFLKGILYLALVPTLVALLIIVELSLSLLDFLVFFALSAYPLLFYAFILVQKSSYTDSEVLDKVEIPNASAEIRDLLKTTTRGTNRLINVDLILALGAKRTLSQSELVRLLGKRGYDLSAPAIIRYISELENSRIFASTKGLHKIEYTLTVKGEWCYHAARKCFPRRFGVFVYRHYLGRRGLSEFPKETNNEHS
jgi:hypothetical protein